MSQSVGAGSMPMTLEEVVEYVHGRLVEAGPGREPDRRSVRMREVTDSRQVEADGLFIAIKGEHVDGHDYVPGLGAKGCRAALVDHLVPGADLPQILVDDTVAALGLLARANIDRRRKDSGPFAVIGITGSVGKTTTKDLLASLLALLGSVVAPVGSFNNEIGLPLIWPLGLFCGLAWPLMTAGRTATWMVRLATWTVTAWTGRPSSCACVASSRFGFVWASRDDTMS